MKTFFIFLGLLALTSAQRKLVCYYDTKSAHKSNKSKYNLRFPDLKPVRRYYPLSPCTHVVFGFSTIDSETFALVPPPGNLGPNANALKRAYKNLKVYLSVGGDTDTDNAEKYQTVLTDPSKRSAFVDSVATQLQKLPFNGFDLAWQFPETPADSQSGTGGQSLAGGLGAGANVGANAQVKSPLGGSIGVSGSVNGNANIGGALSNAAGPQNDQQKSLRDGFTALVQELKEKIPSNKEISVTALPTVNSSIYFDVSGFIDSVDYVNVAIYGVNTPEKNPDVADNSSPLYGTSRHHVDRNGNLTILYWLNNGAAGDKVVMGLTPRGYSWKIKETDNFGVPPIAAYGPATSHTKHSKEPGHLDYDEVCVIEKNKRVSKVHSRTEGAISVQLVNSDTKEGIWVSYENSITVRQKGAFVKQNDLAGLSIMNLDQDDFNGDCYRNKFPILVAMGKALA